MQTSAWRPPIRIPKFNQHWIKLSGDEGMGSITHKVKGIIVLDCIEMRSRKLCWFYTCSVCKLYVCASCAVCPAVLYRCLTPPPSPNLVCSPQPPNSILLCKMLGSQGWSHWKRSSLASLHCYSVNMQELDLLSVMYCAKLLLKPVHT